MPQKLLFISNGHGEDAIGARLAQEFQRLCPDWQLEAVPIVGAGTPYECLGITVSGPRWSPPSGGFTFTSVQRFLEDWRDGMRHHTHAQHWAVRRAKADIVIVVGDVYALGVTRLFAFKEATPVVFQVQPLVSRYYQDGMSAATRLERLNRVTVDNFTAPELFLMRRMVRHVFVRDARTATWLQELGVGHSSFLGNLMMDCLTPELDLTPILENKPLLALLPGTRGDHLYSLPKMLEVAALLPEFQVLAALPKLDPNLELSTGWVWKPVEAVDNSLSVLRTAQHHSGQCVNILSNAFAALLHRADVVLGTSGTGNEQAVGLGKPVVSFATRGPQYTRNFAKAQQRLLGAGLVFVDKPVDNSSLSEAVRQAYKNRELAQKAGWERMGPAGGAARVAAKILELLNA
ncbi:MAG: lipid-A-disaccharide synthase-related protein [Deinococcales bacterium]